MPKNVSPNDMKPNKSGHWLADNIIEVACQNRQGCSCSNFKVGESCLEEEEDDDDFPYPVADWPRPDKACAWDSHNISKMNERKCTACQKDFVNNKPCDCHTSLIRGNKGKNCKMKSDQENSNAATSIIKLSKAAVSQEYKKRSACFQDVGHKKGKNCLECAFKSTDKTIIIEDDNNDDLESIIRDKLKLKKLAKKNKEVTKVDEAEEQGPCFWYSNDKEGKACASCNSKIPESDEEDTKDSDEEDSELTEERKKQNEPCSWLSKSSKGKQCTICCDSSDKTKKKK